MKFNDLRWIVPAPQPDIEILETHQISREFYREVEQREEFNEYCRWYYETAQKNQQELEKMRGDINIFGWFFRGRK
ncbi:MAG: hypothetical protein KME19_02105 [Microcoleus vaginatus WJT46-NPBG5]|jgi:hypothetical protein|nr:hypothetical protein [Microcoleus vaginatus WJT46-NPBG5]